jgi:hypothetical protein
MNNFCEMDSVLCTCHRSSRQRECVSSWVKIILVVSTIQLVGYYHALLSLI